MRWVIPCKYDPVVRDCVASIREHHPNDTIILVDSCSDDQSYIAELDPDHVIIGNQHYAWGAFGEAFDGTDEHWALVHDSLVLKRPVEWVTEHPLVAVNWLWFARNAGCDPTMWAWIEPHETRMGIKRPDPYPLLFGPMMFASPEVMHSIDRAGGWEIKPTDRIGANGMERLGGILLHHLGWSTDVNLGEDDYIKNYRDRP